MSDRDDDQDIHTCVVRLWEHAPGEPGTWHFATLPSDVAEDIALEAGPRGGFGSIRVEVTIGSSTWRTSLFPESRAGSFVLPVKKQVRAREDLLAGEECTVTLRVLDPE